MCAVLQVKAKSEARVGIPEKQKGSDRSFPCLPRGRGRRSFAGVALLLWVAGGFTGKAAGGTDRFLAETPASSPAPRGEVQQVKDNAAAETPKQSTNEFRLSRERYEKAVAYSRARYFRYFVSVTWGMVVLVGLLEMRVVAKLRDFAERRSARRIVQAGIFVPLLFVLLGLFALPIDIYGHSLSLKYQQSVEGWGWWFWDWTKAELIGVVLGLALALILFGVIRRKPKTWWVYFWFASIPFVLLVVFLAPWVLDPLFHKFRPLREEHADLVEAIGKLTERAGVTIPAERMFLMQASAKTNQINAYVTGMGASKRVVVWDNTIQKMAPDEVLFVVGHEMGHYALGHVWKGVAFALGGILLMLLVARYALRWVLGRWGDRWGVRGPGDWAALGVLLLIGSVLGFLGQPLGNGFSRIEEHAADVYGLELLHGIVPNAPDTAAHAFQVMGERDLDDPNPPKFVRLWLYTHPPLAERLKFAHGYDPWGKGASPQYIK